MNVLGEQRSCLCWHKTAPNVALGLRFEAFCNCIIILDLACLHFSPSHLPLSWNVLPFHYMLYHRLDLAMMSLDLFLSFRRCKILAALVLTRSFTAQCYEMYFLVSHFELHFHEYCAQLYVALTNP